MTSRRFPLRVANVVPAVSVGTSSAPSSVSSRPSRAMNRCAIMSRRLRNRPALSRIALAGAAARGGTTGVARSPNGTSTPATESAIASGSASPALHSTATDTPAAG